MDLAAAVAPTTLARQRTLPVADPLIPLLPDGALPRGRAVSCGGIAATSLAVALAAEATVAGAWLAVVDVPWLGVEAAAELGVPLERLVRVDLGDGERASLRASEPALRRLGSLVHPPSERSDLPPRDGAPMSERVFERANHHYGDLGHRRRVPRPAGDHVVQMGIRR